MTKKLIYSLVMLSTKLSQAKIASLTRRPDTQTYFLGTPDIEPVGENTPVIVPALKNIQAKKQK